MKPLTGRKVLLYLVAFFGIVIAVNAWFMGAAVNTFPGEDDLRPYQEGVEYNQTLARRAEQEKLGWKAAFMVSRVDSQTVHVAVMLRNSDGSAITRVALAGEMRHPTDENRDRPMVLNEIRAGDYEGNVRGIAVGAWDLMVRTPAGLTPFEASRRIWVP